MWSADFWQGAKNTKWVNIVSSINGADKTGYSHKKEWN